MAMTTWHKTACNLCYVNCGLEVLVEDGKLTRVRGDKANPKSEGYLCNKAARIPYYVSHRDRLTTPLRRSADGGFEAISWDLAITEIAERIKKIHAVHSGRSFALYGGGGQGNHAGGAYATAVMRALGSTNTFNALAQEKTGDFWVNGHMFGSQTCHTSEDVHHCDLLLAIGCNPWVAHGFPNARDQLNQIKRDPQRKLIVVDPRRTETAQLADLHLAVRPGADAFLLGAILATLVRRDAVDHAFLADHTLGFDEVRETLRRVPIEEWALAADVKLADIDRCVEMIGAAKAMTVRVELGIQQGMNSTLNSYLEKLLIMLTGSFGRKGTNQLHSWLVPLWANGRGQIYSPTGDEIIAGLLPPNSFPAAVLSEQPHRLRAVLVDSSNPANTAANTAQVERALAALDLLVVVDVAMTETAHLAHYVLPASSQFEKTEFTLFNFEFPANYFHVRGAVLPPLSGTLPEPEIYTRLARALGLLPGDNVLAPLREVAARSRSEFAAAFATFMAEHSTLRPLAALVLYNTLGASLPAGKGAAAPLWSAAQTCARRMPRAVRRAMGDAPGIPESALADRLFDIIISAPQGATFSVHTYEEVWSLVEYPDRKIRLAIPSLLEWLATLAPSVAAPVDYPFMLAAGQRRMYNANQIFRDPAWRRSDSDGALLVNPQDLASLDASDGDWVAVQSKSGRLVVRSHADDTMRRGQLSLPHGYGQSYPAPVGRGRFTNGPRINLLTSGDHRDPIAGTPYHKNVPVRLERATPHEARAAEANSRGINAVPATASATEPGG